MIEYGDRSRHGGQLLSFSVAKQIGRLVNLSLSFRMRGYDRIRVYTKVSRYSLNRLKRLVGRARQNA